MKFSSQGRAALRALTGLGLAAGMLLAQGGRFLGQPVGRPAAERARQLEGVGFDQKLNGQLPMGAAFRDETGADVTLGSLFHDRPVLVAPVYYECPMLCTQVLNGVVSSLKAVSFEPGKDFDVVVFSFDPSETAELARQKKETYLKRYGRPETAAGWHFLTADPDTIRQMTDAMGFRFTYDPDTRQFAHASGILVATPEGRIARYLYGIEYAPRDVRLGLIEAAGNKIGNPVDQVLLFCFHYDPGAGKYTSVAMNILRLVAVATLVVLLGFMILMLRRDRRVAGGSAAP